MRIPRQSTVALSIAFAVLLTACPGPATISLSGDATCSGTVSVSGTATKTNGGVSLTVTATVKCDAKGLAGVMLNGVLPVATGNINVTWGPTDANGLASTSVDTSAVAVFPATFRVIVNDSAGKLVTEQSVTIQ